jgi:signal transduction histidine kinase
MRRHSDRSSTTLRVIIVGAGKGGTALLELFTRGSGVEVVAIADRNPQAPGMCLAGNLDIPTSTDAFSLVANTPADLIVDVTGDPGMGAMLAGHKPLRAEVLGGTSALLVRKLAQYERELRDQLIQATKLASIGTMTSGIAHEINNYTYGITGLSQHLRDETRPEVIRECVDEIIEAGHGIAAIVRNLNGYARKATLEDLCDIDLNHTLDEAIKMARIAAILDEVEVVTTYGAVPPVRGRPQELLQIFVNLVTNAVQAMGGRGTLSLSTACAGCCVQATVRDTGPGIPRDIADKIFDPFFTTKEPGKGTGLGLHIVRDIVTRYGGQVTVESAPGCGAAFTVKLPTAIQPREERITRTTDPAVQRPPSENLWGFCSAAAAP